MKITITTYVEKEDSTDYDAVVGPVAEALKQGGHKVSILGIHADPKKLIAGLSRRKPDLVFNLVEMFGQSVNGDVAVTGLYDLLGVAYTGGGPGELYLRQDKSLAKKLLAYEKLLYPDFAVFSKDHMMETGGNLRLPMFVKPLTADASIGIDGKKAIVRTPTELMKRVAEIHDKQNDAALAEEYIEGREFYVAVMGNNEPVAFPPLEMDFTNLPDGAPHILDKKAKWSKQSAEYKATKAKVAELPDELGAKLRKAAIDAYRALRVRDYGRVDIRLPETNDIYILEINANCYLMPTDEFASAAAAAETDYPTLINRIAELAMERYKVKQRK